MFHVPVLVDQVLATLITDKTGTYLDGTAGGGGHSQAILESLEPRGRLVAFDRDAAALRETRKRLKKYGNSVIVKQVNFAEAADVLSEIGIPVLDGVLLDLGVSSHQLDTAERGFSHSLQGKLDMRMNRAQPVTAKQLITSYDLDALTALFRDYGEERHAGALAKAIVRERKKADIETTRALRNIVEKVVGPQFVIKSLSRVFQALRIEVNREIESLETFLGNCMNVLRPGSRIVILSYHSLEDRLVKNFFRDEAAGCVCPPEFPVCVCDHSPRLKILTRRPIRPSQEEQNANPRSRSARLRAGEVV